MGLKGKSKRARSLHVIDHPVNRERAAAEGVGVGGAQEVRGSGLAEGDLEGERDQRVSQREEQVGENGRAPAPDDQLVEF